MASAMKSFCLLMVLAAAFYIPGCGKTDERLQSLESKQDELNTGIGKLAKSVTDIQAEIKALSDKIDKSAVALNTVEAKVQMLDEQIAAVEKMAKESGGDWIEEALLEFLNSSEQAQQILKIAEDALQLTPEQSQKFRKVIVHEALVSIPAIVRAVTSGDMTKLAPVVPKVLDKVRDILTPEQKVLFDPFCEMIKAQVNSMIGAEEQKPEQPAQPQTPK